jgi:hypothetical protein
MRGRKTQRSILPPYVQVDVRKLPEVRVRLDAVSLLFALGRVDQNEKEPPRELSQCARLLQSILVAASSATEARVLMRFGTTVRSIIDVYRCILSR